MKRILCALTLIAAAMAAWPTDASADKYRISSEVWGYFEEYLRNIDQGHKPGAFVITTDGYGAWYTWCEATRCMGGISYSQDALNSCEREYETDCVVFAVREKIKVEYEIVGASSGLSTAPSAPPSPSPPTGRIMVAAAVKVETELQ